MVYTPEQDDLDRPRGILTTADRRYLVGDKRGRSPQNQYKRNEAIKQRTINAFLDLAILENHLDEELRNEIFRSFDANTVFEEGDELYSAETHYMSCLTDMIALLYRQTKKDTGFRPSFAEFLETGIVQGSFEPRTDYYGNYNVEISFEKLPEETVNITSIAERVKERGSESLNEAEMKSLIEIFARSESVNPSYLEEEFNEWVEQFEEENGRPPSSMSEIFSQLDHGEPYRYYLPPDDSEDG